jgi:hypothetical protein
VISVVSAATRIACKQMTLQHPDALQASLEQASGPSARPDWGRKATAHAELFNVLAGLTGDRDLALQVSSAAGRLRPRPESRPGGRRHHLELAPQAARQSLGRDGAARRWSITKGLHYGRLACGANPVRITWPAARPQNVPG